MTNKQNFEKDINVPSKEQIIIDEIECKNYNNGVCQEGDYSGLVANIISCDPQNIRCDFYIDRIEEQLTRKTQECEKIKEKYEALKLENQEGYEIVAELKQECESLKQEIEILQNNFDTATRDCNDEIEILKQECEELKKRATIAEDNFACEVQARLYHQNEWLKFSKECEELKKQLKTSEKWRINAESLNEKLDIKNTRYRKALEEIEEVCMEDTRTFADGTQLRYSSLDEILDIVNKAKGEEKCQ